MNFIIENFYNPHLSIGSSRIDAILSVTSTLEDKEEKLGNSLKKAIIFVIDHSGSMETSGKMDMAKLAVRKSIDLLDENTLFAIIAFSNSAKVIASLNPATMQNKDLAQNAIQKLIAFGGTTMSNAMIETFNVIRDLKDTMINVQFVTDGKNGKSDHNALEEALEVCEGRFQCNCWGIGIDWDPKELKYIANKLLGVADAVPNPNQLGKTFKTALVSAISKEIGNVKLRLQIPKSVKVVTLKQVNPEIVDLKTLAKMIDDKNIEIPLGAWANENREYQVAFELQTQNEGEEMMAGRPKIVYYQNGQEFIVDGDRIVAVWSSDLSVTSRINEQVAHYTGQAELAKSIKEGLEAKSRGDIDNATLHLGKAAKIAIETGNDEVTERLKKVVDIIDEDHGTVKLKSDAGKAEDLELDMGGNMTIRIRKGPKV